MEFEVWGIESWLFQGKSIEKKCLTDSSPTLLRDTWFYLNIKCSMLTYLIPHYKVATVAC